MNAGLVEDQFMLSFLLSQIFVKHVVVSMNWGEFLCNFVNMLYSTVNSHLIFSLTWMSV